MIKLIKPNKYETGFMHCRREEFLLDCADDINLLPKDCVVGSVAYLADMSASYRLSPSKEWKMVEESSSSSSGGGGGVTLWEYSKETFQPSSSGSSFYYIPAEISSFKWVEVVFRIPALFGRNATRFVVVRHLVSDLLVANPDNPFQTPEIMLRTVTEAESNRFTLITAVLNYRGDKFVFDEENQFEYKYDISSGSISVTKNNSYSVGVVPFKIVGYYE